MLSDIQLRFLRERIQEIGSALFSNNSNSPFKIPGSIVSALKVDDRGNIWFFLHKPNVFIAEADKEFPAKLDFYRKGKPFFLQVNGKALVITEEEAIHELIDMAPEVKDQVLSQVILVKVQVTHAEYFEQTKRALTKVETMWHALCKFLLQEKPAHRPYRLHPMILS
jgi:general stress protein 26